MTQNPFAYADEEAAIKDIKYTMSTTTTKSGKTYRKTNSLEGVITLNEAISVFKNMKNHKSPGCDGFTAEFFSFFF